MPPGGKKIEPGILYYMGSKLRAAANYFFGPELPLPPQAPPGTPPRTTDYPVAYNIQIQPRDQEAISYAQMRHLADSYDLVRLCIETRKDQIARMPWEFRLKKEAGETRSDYATRNSKDKGVQLLNEFFAYPDKEHTWQQWIRILVEDILVLDAGTICPIVDPKGTVWSEGKELFALEVIDGATIARKIDIMGRTPYPPDVAYQQIVKGLPAIDFTREQLVYRPRNQRAHKFFGFSPVEQIILCINIALRREVHLLNYYTEGNIPEAIVQVPKEWSADQITEFQDWFDSKLAGNSATRRRVTFVPESGQINWTRDPKLKDAIDEWLARIVCYAFSISPQPFVSQMNRATAETAVEQAAAEGLLPLMSHIDDIINDILKRYFPDWESVEFAWKEDRDQNPVEQSQIWDRMLRNGTLKINQVADEMGLPGIGDAGDRNLIYTKDGVVPLDTAIDRADNPPEPPAIPSSSSEQEDKELTEPGAPKKKPPTTSKPPKNQQETKFHKRAQWRRKYYA